MQHETVSRSELSRAPSTHHGIENPAVFDHFAEHPVVFIELRAGVGIGWAEGLALLHGEAGLVEGGVEACGGGGDHGHAEEGGVGGGGFGDGAEGGVGVELHEKGIARVAACYVQGVDGIAAGVEGFENVPNPERDGDAGAPVETAERVEVAVERQAGDDAAGEGIAEGRAVAMEIWEHVQAVSEGQAFGFAQLHDALADG